MIQRWISAYRAFYYILIFSFLSCQRITADIDPRKTVTIDSLNREFAREENLKISNLQNIRALIASSDSSNYSKGKTEAALTGYLILMGEDNFKDAMTLLETSRSELKNLGDPLLKARVYLYLGQYQTTIRNYELALEYLLKSAEFFPEHRDTARYTATLRETAALYRLTKNRNMVRKYLQQALEMDLKANNLKGISIDYDNLGVFFEESGEMDSARYYYDQGREIYKKRGVDRLYVYNLNNLASFEMKNRNYDSAEELALQALKLTDSVRRISSLVPVIYTNLAIINRYQNDYEQADNYFRKAQERSGNNNKLPFLIEMNHEMYLFYRAWSKHALAYQALDRYQVLLDSNTRMNNQQNLMALEMKDHYLKLKMEEKLRQRKMMAVFLSSLLFLIISVIFLVLLVRQQRIRVKNSRLRQKILDKELETKRRELVSHTLNMVRLNERKFILIQTLKEQLPHIGENNQAIVGKVIKDFETDQDPAIWREFELRFSEVHTNFYDKLARINPNLTINEKRLCAFLLLDMTTKEISSVTGQSPRAIEQARYRLRKQLGLEDPHISLSSFLASL